MTELGALARIPLTSTEPGGPVETLAFGRDGQTRPVLAAGTASTTCVWDLIDGTLRHLLRGGATTGLQVVEAAATGPLLVAADHRAFRIWDLATGEQRQATTGQGWQSMAAGVDGSGRPVAAGVRVNEIKRIVVWGLTDAAVRHVFDMHLVHRGSKLQEIRGVGPVAAVAVTNAGHGAALLAAASQGIVRAWDTDTGAPRLILPTANSYVRALAFGRAGDQLMLAAACQDGLLRVWDARSGQLAHQLRFPGHGFPTSVAFGHADDGRPLLASAGDTHLCTWDPLSGHALHVVGPRAEPASDHDQADADSDQPDADGLDFLLGRAPLRAWSLAVGADATGRAVLVSGDSDGAVRAYDPLTGDAALWTLRASKVVLSAVTVFSDDTRRLRLVVGGPNGTLQAWDPVAAASLWSGDRWRPTAYAVDSARDRDGRVLLATAGHGEVELWHADTGQRLRRLEGHTGAVHSVAFGHDGDGALVLASGGSDGVVRISDPVTAGLRGVVSVRPAWVRAVAVGRGGDGRTLVAAGLRGEVRIYDLETGRAVHRLRGEGWDAQPEHAAPLPQEIAFGEDDDGRALLAAAADDAVVWLWQLDSGQLAHALRGHEATVSSITFGTLAGGQRVLASASHDGTVRIWDPSSAEQLDMLSSGDGGALTSVALGAGINGRAVLVAVGEPGVITVWATGSDAGS